MRTFLFMIVFGFSYKLFAEDGPAVTREATKLIEVRSWEKLNINAQGQGRVFKFVDEVDGVKVVCYVTDTIGAWGVAPGINCLKLD